MSVLIPLSLRNIISFSGKSSPIIDTIAKLLVNKLDAIPIYVPAPPIIFPELPCGVSISSKATVPVINILLFIS